MIELTEKQREALAVEKPPCLVIDRVTGRTYVLVPAEEYDRVRSAPYGDSEWTPDELRSLLARSAAANGWDEPEMDAYDRYDEERRKQCP